MIRLQVLHGVRLWCDGCELELPRGVLRELLALLGLQAGAPVSGQLLLTRLGLDGDDGGRRRLVQLVDRLAELAGPAVEVEAGAATVRLRLPEDGSDLQEARMLAARAEAAVSDPHEEAGLRMAAETVWEGPLLPDLPGAAGWPELRMLQLEQELAARDAAAARIAAGWVSDELVDRLWARAVGSPEVEYWPALLMDALVVCGRLAEAVAVYRHAAQRIDELGGMDPGPGLVRRRDQVVALQQRRTPTESVAEIAILVAGRIPGAAEDDASVLQCIRAAGGVVVWRVQRVFMAVFDGVAPHEQAFRCAVALREVGPGGGRRTVSVCSGDTECFVPALAGSSDETGLVLSGRALAAGREVFFSAPDGALAVDGRTRGLIGCACGFAPSGPGFVLVEQATRSAVG